MRDRPHRLRLIHAARRQLGLDDAAYRSLLAGAAGVTSAADLTDRTWPAVVRALRAAGWRGTGRLQGREAAAYSLWRRLYDLGAVRRRSHQAFRAFVARRCGEQDIYSASQWAAVINSLRQWLKRVPSEPNRTGAERPVTATESRYPTPIASGVEAGRS